MTDQSAFTHDEWQSVTEAPLRITLALVAVGEHGPISVVREAAASARAIARPSERGPADELIRAIGLEAESREARHDVKAHLGRRPEEIVDQALTDLGVCARALDKLPAAEAAEVRAWLVDIAQAVAGVAKSVTPAEQAALEQISDVFGSSSAP